MGILGAIGQHLLNKGATLNKREYLPGTIIKGMYHNAKKDPSPLALILYCGQQYVKLRGITHYTHALNINTLSMYEKAALGKLIISLSESHFPFDAIKFYSFLKQNMSFTIRKAYRTYFTAYLLGNVVSPGFFRAPLPLTEIKDNFILSLNQQLLGYNILEHNTIKGTNKINEMVRKTIEHSTHFISQQRGPQDYGQEEGRQSFKHAGGNLKNGTF